MIKGPGECLFLIENVRQASFLGAVFPGKVTDSQETYVSEVLTCTKTPGEK